MDDKKLLFIVNPRAGKTKSLAPLFDAAAIYSEAGYLVSVRKTTHRGEATELAESLGPEFDVVVCHGGDGAACLRGDESSCRAVPVQEPGRPSAGRRAHRVQRN